MRNPLGALAAASLALGGVSVAVSAHMPLMERTAVLAAAGGTLVMVNEGAARFAGRRRWPGRPPIGLIPANREVTLVLLPALGGAALAYLIVDLAIASALGGIIVIALGGAAAVAAVALLGLLALPPGEEVSSRGPRGPFRRGRPPARDATPSRPSRPSRREPSSG